MKTVSYLDVVYNSFEFFRSRCELVNLVSGVVNRCYVSTPCNTYRVTCAWDSTRSFYEIDVSFYRSRSICNHYIGTTCEEAFNRFKTMFD